MTTKLTVDFFMDPIVRIARFCFAAATPRLILEGAGASIDEPSVIHLSMTIPWIRATYFQGSSRDLRGRISMASAVRLPARSDSAIVNAHRQGASCYGRELNRERGIVLGRIKGIGSSHASRRAAVTVIAILMLAAQLIAAGHVHPGFLVKGVSDGAHLMSEVTCPICVFHAHAPSSAAAAFLLAVPFLSEAFVATARRSRLLYASKPQLFGRAPPTA